MSRFSFLHFMVACAIMDDEKSKREENRSESKRVAQKIRQLKPSNCLEQHKYMYLSKRSR